MRTLALATLLLTGVLPSQSPLTTLFAADNSGAVGGNVYFDLTVHAAAGVEIGALDCNLYDAPGTLGAIEVWTIPGSYLGFENSNAGWSRLAGASIRAAGVDQPSRAVFAEPVRLPLGNHGVALRAIGVAHAYSNGTGGNQTHANAHLTLHAGAALNQSFSAGTLFTPRVVNCRLYHGGEPFAQVVKSGAGCNDAAVSFYELFAAGTFDLGNRAVRMFPAGSGYIVQATPLPFVPPSGTGLGLTDDSTSAPLPLGFSFPYPGGSTSSIVVCSNGFLHLSSTGTSFAYEPTVAEALTGGPRVMPMWGDLQPDGAGNLDNVYFDGGPGYARVTWLNVAEFGNASNRTTMQVTLRSSGVIEIAYQTHGLTATGHGMLTGFSPGANSRDPGNRDLSATLPFGTRADLYPLQQDASDPILGQTTMLMVSNIPAATIGGVELVGLPAASSLDLEPAGMPSCFLHVFPAYLAIPFATPTATATVPLPIRNDLSLLRLRITVQAVTITPAANPFGALSSNAATLRFGTM